MFELHRLKLSLQHINILGSISVVKCGKNHTMCLVTATTISSETTPTVAAELKELMAEQSSDGNAVVFTVGSVVDLQLRTQHDLKTKRKENRVCKRD